MYNSFPYLTLLVGFNKNECFDLMHSILKTDTSIIWHHFMTDPKVLDRVHKIVVSSNSDFEKEIIFWFHKLRKPYLQFYQISDDEKIINHCNYSDIFHLKKIQIDDSILKNYGCNNISELQQKMLLFKI